MQPHHRNRRGYSLCQKRAVAIDATYSLRQKRTVAIEATLPAGLRVYAKRGLAIEGYIFRFNLPAERTHRLLQGSESCLARRGFWSCPACCLFCSWRLLGQIGWCSYSEFRWPCSIGRQGNPGVTHLRQRIEQRKEHTQKKR